MTMNLSTYEAHPGDTITVSACLPLKAMVQDNPFDLYLLVRAPGGTIYSVLYGNIILKGFVPYYSGIFIQDYWCGVLFTHTACTAFGNYAVALRIMPAGVPPDEKDVLGFDITTVRLVP